MSNEPVQVPTDASLASLLSDPLRLPVEQRVSGYLP